MRKQSFYLPQEMADDVTAEAKRLERSPNWLLRRAWQIAREQIKQMPSADGTLPAAPAKPEGEE